ncbi:hypothetical protein C4D60_Mb07t25280 [Musa balbisiana]|uniref:Uncharacterized protein n=1 Tax=Musa balbisiana TaxID=52838 RepID=A0A4S8JKC4_MUSBA|nr:hypothetical protein C4D60_Mb07t25280 [Musa balbisiana]
MSTCRDYESPLVISIDGPSMRANFNLFSLALTINLIRGLPDWTPALLYFPPSFPTPPTFSRLGFLTAVPSPVATVLGIEGRMFARNRYAEKVLMKKMWSTRFMMKLFLHLLDWDTTTWKNVSYPFNMPLRALNYCLLKN